MAVAEPFCLTHRYNTKRDTGEAVKLLGLLSDTLRLGKQRREMILAALA
ncbi:MAG: hypothetical protein ABIT04_04920 [Novosphingobium sp.]